MHRFVPSISLVFLLAACGGGASAPASSTAATSPAASKPAASGSPSAKPAASTGAASGKPAGSAAGGASTKPAASGGAIPSIAAGQKVKIVTATGVPSVVFTPMWIAADTGLFAKYGLDAQLENIEGVKQ